MAFIREIEVEVKDISFSSYEFDDMVEQMIDGASNGDLADMVPKMFAESTDPHGLACAMAREVCGGMDEGEERELLEELDIEVPEPAPQTTEELISALTITATNGEGYSKAELRVIRKWVETAVRRTVADFKSLRSLYRKAGE